MSIIPPAESGPALDRRIAKLFEGPRSNPLPAAYSTEESPAAELVARLEERGITASIEQDADAWYCIFWASRPGDGVKERVASGSAPSRPLAICRAVLNLPLTGSGKRLRLRRALRGWIPDETAPHPAFAGSADSVREPADEGTEAPALQGDRFVEPPRAARES